MQSICPLVLHIAFCPFFLRVVHGPLFASFGLASKRPPITSRDLCHLNYVAAGKDTAQPVFLVL